ncbi:MAG: CDP-diacylglycerol--glycerol-3-phosphate 3-phosphatidyltransferase [Pirellulales bacterium]
MSIAAKEQIAKERVFNVPNQLTVLRLLLSLALFVLIAFQYYLTSFFVFAVAAGTDWMDGYWARKYGQVTTLGRILDPFVDKIIVCGTFILLGAVPGSGVAAWMAVLIVGRELLVTALRSFLEGEGANFSAVMSGKVKMLVQCIAALVSLYALYHAAPYPPFLEWSLIISVWAAVVMTVYSGAAYVLRAYALLTS